MSYAGRESKSSAEALGLLEDPCGERFTRKCLTLVVLLFFPRQVRNSGRGVSVNVSFPVELETQNKGVSTRGTYLSLSNEEEIEMWRLADPGV